MESLFEKALLFAIEAHSGMKRKSGEPYILHPIEVALIASKLTSDEEVISAAVLHDTVEDTDTTPDDILRNFGERVAYLVALETENKRDGIPKRETWQIRKEESLEELKGAADPGVRVVWLADKLSNMRSFHKMYLEKGDSLWQSFHQSDPGKQAWYYRTVRDLTRELSDTPEWREYNTLTEKVFEGVK